MCRVKALVLSGVLALGSASCLNAQTGFTTQVVAAPSESQEVLSADFNGDHRPDVLVGGQYTSGGAYVYLNSSNPDQPYPGATAINGTNQLYHLAVVDLNRDGFPDFVGCSTQFQYGAPTGPFSVLTFLNDGTGHFTLKQTTAPQQGICQGLVVGDVNRDGNPDVVTISQIPSPGMDQPGTPPPPQNFLQSWFGDGAGNLGTPVVESNIPLNSSDSVNCGISSIAGANFFGDGNFNLLLHTACLADNSGTQPASTTFVARNDGDGHYTFTYAGESTETLTAHLVLDVDQDGKPDVITTGRVQPYNSAERLYVEHNDGNGQFSLRDITPPVPSGQTLQFFSGITVGDWNSDNKPDLAVLYRLADASLTYTSYVSILSGSANGSFAQTQSWLAGGNSEVFGPLVQADFNADARPDLIAMDDSADNGQYNLYLYANEPGQNSCAVPGTASHSQICTPANGSTVSSPVTITAASNVNHFTLNRLYLDGNVLTESYAESISTSTTISTGTHTLALVSYSDDGSAITSTNTFTVGTGSGCLPAAAGVRICSPTAGSTQSSPITITAGAVAASGYITAIRSYIDNVAVNTVYNPSNTQSFQINQQVTVGAGAHRLVVVAYESTGGALTKEVDFTAAASASNCYPSSAGAMICSPSAGAAVGSSFSVVAGATAGNGFITAVRVYIDNVAKSTVYNPNQSRSFGASQSVSASAGTHSMVIVGYQSDGKAVTAGENITVQ